MKTALLAIAFLSATAIPGVAADDKYIDDRSDAAALVRSLYNAVNRKEYGRAWDYFGDQKPAKTFDKFVEGYADTAARRRGDRRHQRGRCGRQHLLPGRRSRSRPPTRRATRACSPAATRPGSPIRRSRSRRSCRCIWKRAR